MKVIPYYGEMVFQAQGKALVAAYKAFLIASYCIHATYIKTVGGTHIRLATKLTAEPGNKGVFIGQSFTPKHIYLVQI